MRKFLVFGALVVFSSSVGAQVNEGGRPLAMSPQYAGNVISQNAVPQVLLANPDFDALGTEDALNYSKSPLAPFRIGACIPADISFPNSGILVTQPDGKTIWTAQVKVPDALALGLYYDQFSLPDGVKYFITNANGRQILGAYTKNNNPEDGKWATERVQGEVMNLEMDIDAGVDLSKISMHIDKVADFYRSTSYLNVYSLETDRAAKTSGTSPYFIWDSSASCEINAKCSIGAAYSVQRKATVSIQYEVSGYIYAGSGTLMNNTKQDCTPYVLTATHVEPTNSTSNSTFSTWVFYFLYETPSCTYTSTTQPSSFTVTGASFKARASYNANSDVIVGDFLLVKLNSTIPASDSAYFAGWNISAATPTGTFTAFHHPVGDVKKVSNATSVSPNGDFNNPGANTHWELTWANGGTEPGSSGGALFDPNGRVIGDLSGGPITAPYCQGGYYKNRDTMIHIADYSKISLNWLYTYQQPSSAATRLKDWLDPINTGATTLDAIPNSCTSTGVKQVNNNPANSIKIYPNPTTGVSYVDANVEAGGELSISVLNMMGDKVYETVYANAGAGQYKFDISGFASGVYLVRVSTPNMSSTQKIILGNR